LIRPAPEHRRLDKLTELSLEGSLITPEGRKRFQASMPSLKQFQ
jgi:hypothetical protein